MEASGREGQKDRRGGEGGAWDGECGVGEEPSDRRTEAQSSPEGVCLVSFSVYFLKQAFYVGILVDSYAVVRNNRDSKHPLPSVAHRCYV